MATHDWSRFTNWATALLAEHDVPGAAAGVWQNGTPRWFGGLGDRDRAAGLSPDEMTVFGTGSVTKSFTALAILQLAEAGRLALHDPIAAHLPDLAPTSGDPGAITIHHLLTHTAGFPPLPGRHYAALHAMELDEGERAEIERLLAPFPARAPIADHDGMIRFLGGHAYTMHGAPGARFSYSNEGYALLGAIIERRSGLPYAAYLRAHILDPLGMSRTSAALKETLALDNVTAVYLRRDGRAQPSRGWFHAPAIVATGQVRSCVYDLGRYVEMLRRGGEADGTRLVSPASVTAMATAHHPIDGQRAYGYGLITRTLAGDRVVEHSGGHKGVSAHIGFLPERGLSAVVLTNIAEAPADRLWAGLVNVALGREPDAGRVRRPDHALPEGADRSLLGVYRSEEGTTWQVLEEGGRLVVAQGEQRLPTRAIATDTLAVEQRGVETEFRFVRDQNGAVIYLFAGLRLIPRVGE